MKLILDLCGGTGAWSKPYRDAGYDVRIVTLPGYDVRNYDPPETVHGILAAPPCAMFSLARTTAKIPRDFDAGMEIVAACLKIVWAAKPKWWVLENPRGFLRRFLGKPALSFRPCDFGDYYTKPTDLWGYFSVPKKRPVMITKPKGRVQGGTRDYSFAKKGAGGLTRRQLRELTPPGFARAFFEANP